MRFGTAGLLIVIVLVLTGCGIFGNAGGPEQYTMWGSEFVLQWEPPSEIGSGNTSFTYTLYYREYPGSVTSGWTELGTADASNRSRFRVDGLKLAPGAYEFGIRTVDADGNSSDMHTSTDWSADPATGWILNWLGGAP